jgi:hypothetical protein
MQETILKIGRQYRSHPVYCNLLCVIVHFSTLHCVQKIQKGGPNVMPFPKTGKTFEEKKRFIFSSRAID